MGHSNEGLAQPFPLAAFIDNSFTLRAKNFSAKYGSVLVGAQRVSSPEYCLRLPEQCLRKKEGVHSHRQGFG
jgi:hypothetical protein